MDSKHDDNMTMSLSLAGEIRRTLGRSSRRRDIWAHVALAMVGVVSTIQVDAAELPVACIAGSCGSSALDWNNNVASATISGNTLNVQQHTDTANLNWSRFNISADGVVNFQQPSASSTAINHIHSNDPSRIFGSLNANGRVYLLNRNGVLFGAGSKVNVAGMVASSLKMSEAAVKNGIAGAANQNNQPAFINYTDATTGEVLASGDVRVERGATITTADGGQVLMFAPNVINEGNISTPGGQTLLAAGSPVYLVTSSDPNLRGLMVEVGTGGTVTNGDSAANAGIEDPTRMVGQIVAERGNVTLAGLAVNQSGRVSATTTVREGGSIRLQARDGGSVTSVGSQPQLRATHGGDLTLSRGSVTEVTLANDPNDKTVDANAQPRSQVQLQGHQVRVLEDARITATSGNIAVVALAEPGTSSAGINPPEISGTIDDGSRIYIADGAVLDVSGASVELDMERNVVRAELRGDELADSPIQRDGPLRGQAVFVDMRRNGTRADGSTWQGTSIGDVSGQISLTTRNVAERNLNGGTVSLASHGDVIVAGGSTINLSGGVARYRDGYINTTQLLGSDGKIYDIGDADPNVTYVGTTETYLVSDERWGQEETFRSFGHTPRFEEGYVEGKDAGQLSLLTRRAVLDGDITAEVTVGRHQRERATALAAGQMYRSYDQLPLGAQLVFGHVPRSGAAPDRLGGAVSFESGLVLPDLRTPANNPFDPERDPLPLSYAETRLRPELFGDNRFARVQIHSNESVELPQEVTLQLPGQGALSVAAGQIRFDGQVYSPGGTVELTALETETVKQSDIAFDVGSTAVLDVSGKWVNDSWRFTEGEAQLPPLLIGGGDVTLSANEASLNLAAGSLINVSAGAWMRGDGSVVAGEAGSIELSASRDPLLSPVAALNLGATLLGYGLENGGSLTLSAPEICIAAAGGCGTQAFDGLLTLRPEQLLSGGFGDLTLISNERGLTVAADTQIDLRQSNWLLDADAQYAASGTALDQIATVTVLPDHLRTAADLTLRTAIPNRSDNNRYDDASFPFAAVPTLTVQDGAVIRGDVGATIALRSNSSVFIDGTIEAPAGTIDLRLDNSLAITNSVRGQGIWLGANARLDASGATVYEPNEYGLRQGEVLNGGRVQVLAERGVFIANPGSQIDVSGTSAVLDITSPEEATHEATTTTVASNGGRVDVRAADGILLNGDIDAHAGVGTQIAIGGDLRVTLDASQRNLEEIPVPVDERRIVITQASNPLALGMGTPIPDSLAQRALIAADDVEAAGFDSVTLTARTTTGKISTTTEAIVPGAIEFDGDVSLSVGRSLVFDAARITGDGDVSISAPYVAIGHTDKSFQQTPTLVAPDSGSFQVNADFLEAIGHSTIDGFESVRLNSDGDLRLRGVLREGQTTITGSLRTSSDLTLRADQIYGATLSDFTLAAEGDAERVLRIEATGEPRATVLSAGSHLTLSAPTIQQAGVLRAPFGTIDLKGQDVQLESGSLTSTSAEGAIIPFGTTQAGKDWVYSLRSTSTLVVGDTTALPEQTVALDGERVSINNGAVIDVSGGGDLLAHEYVPGPTGSRDVLSALEQPGQFAIVPGLNIDHAPFDPQESSGSTLTVGDNVHLSGGVAGLPEGNYVLLPARYALLKGAYLVRPADGYTDLRSGTAYSQLSGSTIISGRRVIANTQFADARTSGFEVLPAIVVAKLAKYNSALASDFFIEQAEANETAVPRLPQDAGVLAITAGDEMLIDGTLRAGAGKDGRGAAVDISARNLRITEGEGEEGEVAVSAASLSRLGAESLLLGGRRSSTNDGTQLNVAAQNVTVDADASLSAPEILIAANDTARVAEGATLTATSKVAAVDTYLVEGDSAVLRLASGDQAEIRRSNEATAVGTLILEQGAQLTATGGALALDASLDTRSEATLSLAGGSLSFGASRINLGAAGADAGGLTLDDTRLSGLGLNELVLVSRSTIDLYGDVSLDVDDVSLDAAGIRGMTPTAGGSITSSKSIELTNRGDRTSEAAGVAAGALALNASEIIIGDGTQQISGYETVSLNATTRVRAEDNGGLSVAGDLTMVTPALVAATGANTTINAAGALNMRSAVDSVAGVQGAELGGKLTLRGASVDVATRVEAAAGNVSIAAATGDVTLSRNALIDVSGRERNFDGIIVAAPSGNVKLTSTAGDVITRAGSTIDVSAAGRGEAGSITVNAADGSLDLAGVMRGSAQASTSSGHFNADAQNIGTFSALNTALNDGGFFSEREIRQRSGNLTVDAADTVRAHDLSLTADQGDVLVRGTIDARGANGGDVTLSARRVHLSGSILANATATEGDGGQVDLRALNGLTLSNASLIDVAAGASPDADGGEARLRVDRAALLDDEGNVRTDAVRLAGTIRGSERTSLEAVKIYDHADAEGGILGPTGAITSALTAAVETNVLFNEARQFMGSQSAILEALGRADDASFILMPGVEIQTDGDLTLGTDSSVVNWNLNSWRFGTNGNVPGVLTLRAGNNLKINGALSDGFLAANGSLLGGSVNQPGAWRLPGTPSDSWSYRLVAGADNASADVMAVNAAAATEIVDEQGAVIARNGSFSIAPATTPPTSASPMRMVRTGNGNIDVAAAGDFVLGNQRSVLYTAGVASPIGLNIGNNSAGLGARPYPIDGGDINIDVLGDIKGAKTDQLVTDWLWRAGESPNVENGWATGWTVNFARFQQNVGALAGGDVNVSAGGNIRDFSVSIPSIGRQVGSGSSTNSQVDIIGGGTLDVYAGGDVVGGSYYVGLGTGNLRAEGDLARTNFEDVGLTAYPYPILALGDGVWNVTARGSVGIEGVVNPTLLPNATTQGQVGFRPSYFSTYATDSALRVQSVAGDLELSNDTTYMGSVLGSMPLLGGDGDEKIMLQIRPPTLQAIALSGDISLSGEMTLYPGAGSTVELLADGSVIRNPDSALVQLRQSDADPAALPTVEAPVASAQDVTPVLGGINRGVTAQHAPVPVHAGDDSVARIVARTGDIKFSSSSSTDSSMLSFSTPVRIVAAGDIVDLPLSVQHDDANDISSLVAGGDITYRASRSNEGANIGGILPNMREIVVDGPGLLQLVAGGEVDLRTSGGITTRGNVVNSNLPNGGASISVMAGASEADADYDAVIARYLELGQGFDTDLVSYIEARTGEDELTLEEAQARFTQLTEYRQAMLAYVERKSGRDDLTEASALALFRDYTPSEQRELVERVVFSELRFSGREAAKERNTDVRRGFTALQTLFPGANPDTEAGETNPYSGDIALYFSRIYTLDGGDISLLAPGGEVNVGLAAPPASFGLVKGASELGLVAQSTGSVSSLSYRDFAVNESRVFAADGGDILVWSTNGDIDAGRGAKTAISAPPPTISFDSNGRVIVNFPASLTGSGIQTLATSKGVKEGNVDLFAPRGVVNAGDAGIIAGNLTIAATAVLGADNIQVSGVAVGLPPSVDGLGAGLAGVTAAASSAANSATTSVDSERDQQRPGSSLADSALSWLEVFVVGLGEEGCAQSDLECLKRQPPR